MDMKQKLTFVQTAVERLNCHLSINYSEYSNQFYFNVEHYLKHHGYSVWQQRNDGFETVFREHHNTVEELVDYAFNEMFVNAPLFRFTLHFTTPYYVDMKKGVLKRKEFTKTLRFNIVQDQVQLNDEKVEEFTDVHSVGLEKDNNLFIDWLTDHTFWGGVLYRVFGVVRVGKVNKLANRRIKDTVDKFNSSFNKE